MITFQGQNLSNIPHFDASALLTFRRSRGSDTPSHNEPAHNSHRSRLRFSAPLNGSAVTRGRSAESNHRIPDFYFFFHGCLVVRPQKTRRRLLIAGAGLTRQGGPNCTGDIRILNAPVSWLILCLLFKVFPFSHKSLCVCVSESLS